MGKPAIYLRVSTSDQRERQSIQSQEQVMLAWLKAQGREPDSVHWYRDDGVSGRAPIIGRGEGAQLAQAIRDGTVTGYVAVYSVSRISRAAADYFQFRELLQQHNVEFITVSEGVDSQSEGGDLTAGLLAVISEEQVRSMLRSIRAGHERAARDGRWQGQAPFGYRVIDGRLQIHEPDAAIVREMFQRYADGDGAHVLSLWLEDSAIPAPRGGARWPLATVIRLLRNPVYIGKAVYNKRKNVRTAGRVTGHAPRDPEEYITIDTPALIDLATWERVQQRQATRRRQHGIKGHAYAQTLIPRVYCVECGARCYAAKHSGTGKMYYQHERRFPERYGDCKAVGAIHAPRLDSKVWYFVEQALSVPDYIIAGGRVYPVQLTCIRTSIRN